MDDVYDRSDRFEMIAACDEETLVVAANTILDGETEIRILQEPAPQLVMHQVTEPVEKRPFNLGEILVTAAEVELEGERGFAMIAGKSEAKAISGAIIDAAVAAEHPHSKTIATNLEEAVTARENRRQRQWAESRATTVEFETMEDEL
jgi:alpha-D-ribose 1-methylphosphonate 5-triphosphate synthase subunit PhnG